MRKLAAILIRFLSARALAKQKPNSFIAQDLQKYNIPPICFFLRGEVHGVSLFVSFSRRDSSAIGARTLKKLRFNENFNPQRVKINKEEKAEAAAASVKGHK